MLSSLFPTVPKNGESLSFALTVSKIHSAVGVSFVGHGGFASRLPRIPVFSAFSRALDLNFSSVIDELAHQLIAFQRFCRAVFW